MKFRYTGSDNLVVTIGGTLRTIHPQEIVTCNEDLRKLPNVSVIYPKNKKIGDSNGNPKTNKSQT